MLANRLKPQLVLSDNERGDDAVAGSRRRAPPGSLFGRAPVVHDLRIAFTIWGFLDPAPPAELVALRLTAFEGAADPHHYDAVRAIAEACRGHAEHVAGRGQHGLSSQLESLLGVTDADRSQPRQRGRGSRRGSSNSSAETWVASSTTGHAAPWPSASAQRRRTRTTGRRAQAGEPVLRRGSRQVVALDPPGARGTARSPGSTRGHPGVIALVLAAAGPVVPGDGVNRARHQLRHRARCAACRQPRTASATDGCSQDDSVPGTPTGRNVAAMTRCTGRRRPASRSLPS